MYLKALEIQGFKSFPDKTVLNFGADITAIVGPNGSGKSNISDAILWVMGEQNSRQLRGAKMEDVIFGGTEKRNQMGFAQVTLIIDNTGHIFPRDESEVAVTRRYYRSGESEYYINRQSVRLKDVNELFMDTGMGREGYSIIGQGKIDEILSVKSGERREVFEEAAGISKFRHRKEESERKLQRTEENLVRINDKIAELELQVEPLRQQAETAKKYLVLRDELRVLEISVWLENLQALRAGALKLEADLRTAQEDRQRAQADLDAVYAAGEESLEKIRDNDVRAEALRGQVSQLDAAAQEETSAMAVLENSLSHDKQTLERLDRELADTQQRAGNLRTQADALTDRIDQIDAEAQDLARQLEELMDALRQLAESAGSAQQEAEALRAKETLAVADAARGRTELAALDATRTQAQARQAAIAADSAAAREKLDQCRREAEENNASLTAAREEEQAAANVIQGHSLKMEGRRRPAGRTATPAAGRHGGPHPSADGDGEGLRGLLPGGEGRDAGGGPGHPVRDPRPRGKPYDHRPPIHRGPGDRPGRGFAEHRGGPGHRRQGGHLLPEAPGRGTRHVPAHERHPGRYAPGAAPGPGIRLRGHRLPSGDV